MRPARTVLLGLLVVALAGWASVRESWSEPVHKPRHATPAHSSRTAPDVTATIVKPSVSTPPATPANNDDEIPSPFTLPVASRARVRACGETWRDMKLAGTTGDDDWRDFALKCLVGK